MAKPKYQVEIAVRDSRTKKVEYYAIAFTDEWRRVSVKTFSLRIDDAGATKAPRGKR